MYYRGQEYNHSTESMACFHETLSPFSVSRGETFTWRPKKATKCFNLDMTSVNKPELDAAIRLKSQRANGSAPTCYKGVLKATIGLSVSWAVDFSKVGSAPQFARAARWPECYAMLEPMSMHDLGCVKFQASHYHPPPGAGAPGLWHMVTSTLSGGDPTTRLSLRYFGWPSIDLPPASHQELLYF